ncbi:MAG TPA: DUF4178 domain-containing protein, partial [Thermoanaerobaculia bacterium]|nr:DUF4178 domain-containing protein [Thermoanaerobaculia bacterium]
MSARAAHCPNCGAEVLFAAGSSLVTVCRQCRAAVARKGVNVEAIGIVAELVPTSSPFKVGMSARPKHGIKPFRIVGRLQLSTGEGTWDEWHVAFESGGYAWLAEAQGAFWMMQPLPAPPVPEWETLRPGERLNLGAYGMFTVAERRDATYASAEGDLPFVAPPGAVFRYADISGADGSLGTLDYGDDPGLDGFFVGRKVELPDLGIEGLAAWTERKTGAKAQALNCPSCGGALSLKDPASTVRIACQYCGSLLGSRAGVSPGEREGPPSKFEVLEKLSAAPFTPRIPLGASGTLDGRPYVLLGAVVKKTSSGGTDYFWTEYLLKETKSEAYHWLAESNGHWTVLAPVAAGEVNEGPRFATYRGQRYRVFNRNAAVVDAVLGEFYWAVKKGETTQASDYVAPPRMLSKEEAATEINWTEGVYVSTADVEKGFGLPASLPAPTGVGACQPWPDAGKAHLVWQLAGILAAAAVGIFVVATLLAPRKVVFDRTYDLVDPQKKIWAERGAAASGAWGATRAAAAPADRVLLSEPFETTRQANLKADFFAATSNNWVGAGADLIAEGTGEVRSFYLLSDRYSGVDGGESWSEGS